jgi:tetratricopeptide (TPR) repeat protein
LVSQFAREKLAENPGQARLVEEWYCEFYLDWAGGLDLSLAAKQPLEVLNAYSEELPNLLRVWKLLLARDPIRLQGLLIGLFTLYDLQGRYREGIDLFYQGLDELLGNPAVPALQATLNIYIGALYQVWGHGDEAQVYLQAGQALAKANHLPREKARALIFTIRNLHQAGEYALVGGKIDEALDLSRQIGDEWVESSALYLRGLQAYREGRIDDARAALEISLEYARRHKAPLMITSPLNTLGDLLCFTGDYTRAIEVFTECLDISRHLNSPYQISVHTNNLGTVYHVLHMLDQASQMYGESLAYCRLIDDRLGMAVALSNLGEVELALHHPDRAGYYHRQALTIGETLNNRWTIIMALNNLAEIAILQKDMKQAASYLRRAAEQAVEAQAVTIQMKVVLTIARFLDLNGQTDLASQVMQLVRDHPGSEQDLRQHAQAWLAQYNGTASSITLSPQEILQNFIKDKAF